MAVSTAAGRPPNIVVVTCHDLGRHLGCYGATVQSPHLDTFAADAVRFARAFCTAPQCSPSRASLYTGRYPHENGVMGLTHANFAWDLHPDERHIGQILRDAGYRTALVGIHHESRRDTQGRVAARCGMDEMYPPARGAATSDVALECLRRFAAGDHPFYLQIGYLEPHRIPARDETDAMGFRGDYIAPDDAANVQVPPYLRDDLGTRTEIAELNGAVHYVDAQIGRVLDGLRDLGLDENTLVVFTPDHGLALPRAKCSLYEPGLEVALLVRWPTRGWSGRRTENALVPNVDVFATLVEAAGLPVAANVTGRSLAPLLDRDASYTPRDHLFAEMTYHDYYDPRRSLRTEQWKVIVNFTAAPAFMDPSQSWRPRSTAVTPINQYHPLVELYNLDADPVELTNLAENPAHADTRRDLLTRLHEWMRDTGDPLLAGAVTSPMHTQAVSALTDSEYRGVANPSPVENV